jgi:hypothetical protein
MVDLLFDKNADRIQVVAMEDGQGGRLRSARPFSEPKDIP